MITRRTCLTGLAGALLLSAAPTIVGAQERRRVTLRLNWTPNAEHAPYYLGLKNGFYAEAGIDLQILPGSGSANAVKLVGAGNDMFGVALADSVVIGRGREVPVTSAGVMLQQTPNVVASMAAKGIVEPKDLDGKRFGVEARSSSGAIFAAFAQAVQLDVSKVQQVELGTTAGATALISNIIDACIILATNEKVAMEAEGERLNIIDVARYGVKVYGQCLFTSDALAARDPALVAAMRDATFRSWEYCRDNIDKAIAVLKENVPETDTAIETAKWREIAPRTKPVDGNAPLGTQTVKGWTSTYETFARAKLIDRAYDPAELIAKLA